MRKQMILGGLVALGLTAGAVSTTNAAAAPEKRHEDRHEVARHEEHRDFHRDEHVRVEHRDYIRGDIRFHDRIIDAPVVVAPPVVVDPGYVDAGISIGSIPPPVLDACNRLTGGAPITGAQFVHLPGARFYDLQVATPNGIQTLRFGINGGFFGYR